VVKMDKMASIVARADRVPTATSTPFLMVLDDLYVAMVRQTRAPCLQ
jgi:hypothetical protein